MPEPKPDVDNPPVDVGHDDPPKSPEPDKKEPDKPDTSKKSDDGHGEKVDKKRYDDAQAKITTVSQENADLRREKKEMEDKLKPPPEPEKKGRPSTEVRLAEAKRRLKETEDEGVYDPYHQQEKVYDLEKQLEDEKVNEVSRKVQEVSRKVQDDFDSFINFKDEKGKTVYFEELDKGLYTIQDLNEIKDEVAKKGFAIDYASARDKFISRSMEKYQEFNAKRLKEAENANTLDGEHPDPQKPNEEDKDRDRLFPDG